MARQVVQMVSLALLAAAACTSQLPSEPQGPHMLTVPQRSEGSMTGSAFAAFADTMAAAERYAEALAQVRSGNIPPFLRHMVPVHLEYTGDGSVTPITATVWVTPDYLSIGSDEDFLRIPLGRRTASTIARELRCILPTRKIVDAIHEQAAFHFRPQPMPPGPQMRSVGCLMEHRRLVEKQREGRPLGELVSGHKKDLVITNRLWGKRDRVAIYGWHNRDNEPIQPLSTVHGVRYADYSHGVRLVSDTMLVNGRPISAFSVLQDPKLAPVITYEGVIRDPRALMSGKLEPK